MSFELDDLEIEIIDSKQKVISSYDFKKYGILNCASQHPCGCKGFCGCEEFCSSYY